MSQELLALANLLRPERSLAEMVGKYINKKYGSANLVAFNEDGSVEGLSADNKDKLYVEWAEKVKAKDFDYFSTKKVTPPKAKATEPEPEPTTEEVVKEEPDTTPEPAKEKETPNPPPAEEKKVPAKKAAKKAAKEAVKKAAPAAGGIEDALCSLIEEIVEDKLSGVTTEEAPAAALSDEELEARIRKILTKILAGG